MRRTSLAWLTALALAACASPEPPAAPAPPAEAPALPEPTPIAKGPEVPMAVRERQRALSELSHVLDELEPKIGRWPPRITSASEAHELFARWRNAFEKAQALDVPGGQDPVTLWLVGSVYRQGHNLDVKGTAELAAARFESCLALDPTFVQCHLGLGRLYLASKPEQAVLAEQHLRKARELYAPSVHPDLEQDITLALLLQGRTDDALAHIDAYLAEQPGDAHMRDLRNHIAQGHVKLIEIGN
ncbi:MAG TPA: hypothetical protein VMW35_00050 [Myxococcota bacterium]|jgi:tetratricopeptide (TPR) repeat protein|nr:hypothetical protein [Myxococcota bacterium]